MKVLHLIPTLTGGGAERQIVNLVSSTEGIEHVVCVIGDAEFFAPDIEKAGFEVIRLGIFSKHPFIKAALKFRKVVDEVKPDVIHSWLYDANISARLASFFRRKIPLVTSFQSADYEPDAIRNAGWHPLKIRGLKAIDKLSSVTTKPYFVPCSHFVKKSYEKHYGIDEARTTVIYNSVNPELLDGANGNSIRRELNLPNSAFIFLNVGRLDKPKNHRTLIEAFRQVQPEVSNVFLLIAGAGDLENELKAMNVANVVFLGRRSDIGALLAQADVFVFPSLLEGLPVALIEAMFKSLPCIASNIEVFKEVVKDNETGLLVNPFSISDLKTAMMRLYNDEGLRARLGANAFHAASTQFNTSTTARQWEDFYKKVIDYEK